MPFLPNMTTTADALDHGSSSDPRTISERTQRTWLDDDGIVHAESLPGAEQTLADAEACIAFMWEVAGRRRRPVLIDLRRAKSMDRAARTYYAGPNTSDKQIASALLIDSPLSRVMGNFFLGLNKPQRPTRLFTSQAEAIAWLRGFVE